MLAPIAMRNLSRASAVLNLLLGAVRWRLYCAPVSRVHSRLSPTCFLFNVLAHIRRIVCQAKLQPASVQESQNEAAFWSILLSLHRQHERHHSSSVSGPTARELRLG